MAADPPADGYLVDLYRQYIGEPEDRTDVYLGFGLFLGGISLAVVALALFLWSTTLELRSDPYFAWVRPAYALVMVALPVAMLGIVVLLPSQRRMLYTSIAGTAVTVGATVGFWFVYPDHWNFMGDTDYTVEVTATYAVGLAGLTAATGAALIAHYLDMAKQVQTIETEADEPAEDESYSDEEIRQDIDDAMEDVELSWGGVEETDHKRLQFSGDEFDEVDVDMEAKTTRSTGVDAQVAGLKGLKGGDTKTTTSSSTVDDQTAKLTELREQQQADDASAGSSTDDGPVASILDRIRGLFDRT
ncbi:permease [Salinadaptatus halalkaliphilus]|uniref:Permease n=1 Tax=Salinadaptatus halalkaliphilus TaxID=2419781 RepID=A0A4V3VLB5_9EURY|nr:permease [Salinadaptatus halalkaliphilus]THE65017.1 permease [Salinadaptatus halalkaliphilus]